MQGSPKIIQSPYSGEYIRPRINTREDQDTIYTEAIYMCPSSGNFVKKVVISTEPKKKIVSESTVQEEGAFATGARLLSQAMPYYYAYTIGKGIVDAAGSQDEGQECDADDPDCDNQHVHEDDQILYDDEVLDAERGETFVEILKGIKSKINGIEDGKLVVSRSNLFQMLEEISDDIDQILSSVVTNSSEKEIVADEE